jgi:hypothetical protein
VTLPDLKSGKVTERMRFEMKKLILIRVAQRVGTDSREQGAGLS